MEYDNTNRGALHKNENKTEDKHPDYSGSINVGGTDYWLSAWVKESQKTGKKFFSMSVKPKDAQAKPPAKKVEEFSDSDIPF